MANLENADLTGASLEGANLTGANLDGCILQWADLRDADLTGASGMDDRPETAAGSRGKFHGANTVGSKGMPNQLKS